MLFSSITFIFFFLPIVIFLYFITKKELRNYLLLIASLIFYASSSFKHLVLIIGIIIINYIGGLLIEKSKNHKKNFLYLSIGTNIIILLFFKYFNFLIDNINEILNYNIDVFEVILPLGISFYIFQAMSYIFDIYRGENKAQKDITKFALYICLFPQLVAGPIIKYHDIEKQLSERYINFSNIVNGAKRFIIGLSKKVLIANTLGLVAERIFTLEPDLFSHSVAWLGAVTYSLQIYFDFSGYSDMAIGLGLIFGFKFMENFNYPYISKSLTEFWHRWHISLSTWFKQYVYIPLGGNKEGKTKTIRNLGIVFLLTGIWHGASWTFIIWGIWHGCFIILEKLFNIKDFENKYNLLPIKIFQHIYCILVVVLGFTIFRAEDLNYAIYYLRNLICIWETNLTHTKLTDFINSYETIIFVIAFICCMPIFKNILDIKNPVIKGVINIILIILLVMSTASIASDTFNPFIYFKF